MEFTAANLEYAVSVFYNCEANERAQAHQWLTAAQRCPEAWSFVWELLQHHKGTEVQFFAATTLHTKLLRCWNEVPPENYEELKNKILESILAYANGPKIVLNRLCISLAAFILQQGAVDLGTVLRPLSSNDNLSVLLEVLTVIPEEFNSMTMAPGVRSRTQSALQGASPAVLDDMLRHLRTAAENTTLTEESIHRWSKAASCVTSWLVLGGDGYMEANPESSNLKECLPLCEALLRVVHRIITGEGALSESGLEACEAALGAVRAAAAAPAAVALRVASMLGDLTRPLLATEAGQDCDEDLLASLLTCAVAIGESHTRSIARAMHLESQSGDSSARQLVELLLACQSAPGHYPLHETRSSLTFGFWYMLQDEVTYLELTSLNSVFSTLLDILIVKSEAPTQSNLGSDDEELLRRYRQDIADTVMSCWNVLQNQCWDTLDSAWDRCNKESEREAVLHVFLALSDAAPTREDTPPQIARMLQHAAHAATTTSDSRYLDTCLECLGTYAVWLGSRPDAGGELSRAALQAAGGCLLRAPARAALALRKLCAECRAQAAPVAREVVAAALSSHGRYESWVMRQLLGAAGAALCSVGRAEALELLAQLADSLYKDLAAEGEDIKRLGERSAPRGGAEAAGALLTALSDERHLAATLLATLLPTLPPLASHPLQVVLLFQLLKQVVQVLMEDCLPIVSQLSELVLQGLTTSPCAAGMEVVRLMVLMLGDMWSGGGAFLRVSVSVSVRACRATELSAAADVAEGLFLCLCSLAKKRPQVLDSLGDLLPQVVELGCACVPLWESGAARGAVAWLAALAAARPADLRAHAPRLAAVAVQCIGGATPRNQVEPLADLLLALNRAPWSEQDRSAGDLAAWLRHALEPNGFPSHHATHKHKQDFISNVVKNKRSRRRVIETVQVFSLVCRGLIETEYGRQTLAARQLVS